MSLDHNASLRQADPAVARLVDMELRRQQNGLELIASENFASRAVIDAMGTPLTNKYAEGYPGRRYYGGCEVVDQVEQLAIDRLKQLFGAEHANVQPHSGAQANFAAFMAVIPPGEKIMGMALPHGGHLSHGASVNHSGRIWHAVHYGVDPATGRIDYDVVRQQAVAERPKLIIAGGSAYARIIDFEIFRSIADEVGALFLVDMAHFAGLVAGGIYPSPVPHAQIVTSTTHKTLRGPRAGLILSIAEHAKAIDKSVFPGTQGGPLEHVIAAKAVAFGEALTPTSRPTRGAWWKTPRCWPARSSISATPSSPAAPTRISCSSICGPRISPARPRRRRSARPGSPSTRTPSPTTRSHRSSPAAFALAPRAYHARDGQGRDAARGAVDRRGTDPPRREDARASPARRRGAYVQVSAVPAGQGIRQRTAERLRAGSRRRRNRR